MPDCCSFVQGARGPRRITTRIALPTSAALLPEGVSPVLRERAQRRYADIRRWTEFPRGGHFFAAEKPDLLAEELRAFLRPFRHMHATSGDRGVPGAPHRGVTRWRLQPMTPRAGSSRASP
jgi:hypothetical protein